MRDCVLARLVIGDPTGDIDLAVLADQALLDHGRLAEHVSAPISRFWASVHRA